MGSEFQRFLSLGRHPRDRRDGNRGIHQKHIREDMEKEFKIKVSTKDAAKLDTAGKWIDHVKRAWKRPHPCRRPFPRGFDPTGPFRLLAAPPRVAAS